MKHIIWILLLALTISACSTTTTTSGDTVVPSETVKSAPPKRLSSLNNIQNWHLSGKIAVQTAKDSGSANVDWSQRQSGYYISMLGPLGSNGMKLSGHPGSVTLQTSDGKSFHAASAEQLLAKQWGYNLPVSSMRYWIRSLPVPGVTANTQYDSKGRLATLVQQGWRVNYESYTNSGGVDLPQRLSIASPSLKVKIVVYQWRLG